MFCNSREERRFLIDAGGLTSGTDCFIKVLLRVCRIKCINRTHTNAILSTYPPGYPKTAKWISIKVGVGFLLVRVGSCLYLWRCSIEVACRTVHLMMLVCVCGISTKGESLSTYQLERMWRKRPQPTWRFQSTWACEERDEQTFVRLVGVLDGIFIYDMIYFNCSWVDIRWQQYSTHLHTNNTQNNTMKQYIQNRAYITIRIHKHDNKYT